MMRRESAKRLKTLAGNPFRTSVAKALMRWRRDITMASDLTHLATRMPEASLDWPPTRSMAMPPTTFTIWESRIVASPMRIATDQAAITRAASNSCQPPIEPMAYPRVLASLSLARMATAHSRQLRDDSSTSHRTHERLHSRCRTNTAVTTRIMPSRTPTNSADFQTNTISLVESKTTKKQIPKTLR